MLGLNDAEVISWPGTVTVSTCFPDATFHILAVPSSPPVTTYAPFLLNATPFTLKELPLKVRINFPVMGLQNAMTPYALAVATMAPFGLKATPLTATPAI